MITFNYYNDLILKPSPEGDVAIVCGWTKREKLLQNISEDVLDRVCAIGQLYSKEGINYIIRNIFLNPQIKHIILTGLDLSGSLNFFRNFLDSLEKADGILHQEIPEDKISVFLDYFFQHHYFIEDVNNLSTFIGGLPKEKGSWIGYPLNFPDPPYVEASNFPSELVGIRLEDKKVANLWLKVLDRILKFGRDKKSQYGDMQRELTGMITVVSDESPDNFFLPNFLTYGEKELSHYLNQIMTANIPEGLEYTYGSRLRNHGAKYTDQIKSIIDQIKEEDYTRRAVAVTWDVEVDDLNPKAPCLDLVQALVSENKVHFVCYIRSNDMFGAWPQNAMAMRAVQKEICDATGKNIGKLMIISTSAHIYERDFEKALLVVRNNKSQVECIHDPRGNFVISLKDGKIFVTHLDPEGRQLQMFKGKNATEVFDQLYSFVSDSSHALYLGAELQKAEIALNNGLKFVQDNPLVF